VKSVGIFYKWIELKNYYILGTVAQTAWRLLDFWQALKLVCGDFLENNKPSAEQFWGPRQVNSVGSR
jgi:hypothetical protein